MPTGTGTLVSPVYEVTAGAIVAEARAALGDGAAAVYDDAELLRYVNEAIAEYSVHLPRTGQSVVVLVAGARTYALPRETTAVVAVDYRAGAESVPLRRLSYRHPRFTGYARLYDFLPRGDLTAAPTIMLSFEPAVGALLSVRHEQPHAHDLALNEVITVPAAHHHVLVAYVLFAAARRLQLIEQAGPTSGGTLLMGQLASNARRLELAYLGALNRILGHGLGQAEMVVWG